MSYTLYALAAKITNYITENTLTKQSEINDSFMQRLNANLPSRVDGIRISEYIAITFRDTLRYGNGDIQGTQITLEEVPTEFKEEANTIAETIKRYYSEINDMRKALKTLADKIIKSDDRQQRSYNDEYALFLAHLPEILRENSELLAEFDLEEHMPQKIEIIPEYALSDEIVELFNKYSALDILMDF